MFAPRDVSPHFLTLRCVSFDPDSGGMINASDSTRFLAVGRINSKIIITICLIEGNRNSSSRIAQLSQDVQCSKTAGAGIWDGCLSERLFDLLFWALRKRAPIGNEMSPCRLESHDSGGSVSSIWRSAEPRLQQPWPSGKGRVQGLARYPVFGGQPGLFLPSSYPLANFRDL